MERVADSVPCSLPATEEESLFAEFESFDETPAASDQQKCNCIVGKHRTALQEGMNDHFQELARGFGQLFESRFIDYAQDLELMSHNLQLLGFDSARLHKLGGNDCFLGAQLDRISCGSKETRMERMKQLFGVEGASYQEVSENFISQFMAHRQSVLKMVPGQAPTPNRCLNLHDIESIITNDALVAADGQANPDAVEALKLLYALLNGDRQQIDSKQFDQFGELTPYQRLKKLRTDPNYDKIYKLVEQHPFLKNVFSSTKSLERLRLDFTVPEKELENPQKFFGQLFSKEGNYPELLFDNIKSQCVAFEKQLEQLLCNDIANPYIDDEKYQSTFLRPIPVDKVDSLEEAFGCHDKMCQKSSALSGLEEYCLNSGNGLSLNSLYGDVKSQMRDQLFNAPEMVDTILPAQGQQYQELLCSYLVCRDIKDRANCAPMNPMRSAMDVYKELGCPNEQQLICSSPMLSALMKYQEQKENAGIVSYQQQESAEGESYRIKKESNPFSDAFWDAPEEEAPEIVVRAVDEQETEVMEERSSMEADVPEGKIVNDEQGQFRPASRPATVVGRSDYQPSALQGNGAQVAEIENRVAEYGNRVTKFGQEAMKQMERYQQMLEDQATPEKRPSTQELGATVDVSAPSAPERQIAQAPVEEKQISGARREESEMARPISDGISSGIAAEMGGAASAVGKGKIGGGLSAAADQQLEDNGRVPASIEEQVVEITPEQLPKLEELFIEEHGLDPNLPFVVKIKAESKIYEIPVVPLLVEEGRQVYRPENIEQIERENQPLYLAILESPIFSSFFQMKESERKKGLDKLLESI